MQKPMSMPGSMSGMQPNAAPQTTAGAYAPPAQPQGEAASPEEQAAYDAVVQNAGRVIHSEGFSNQIAGQLMSAKDPTQIMAKAVATVMVRVLGEAKKQGAAIPPEVVIPATGEAYELVAEIAERIGAPGADDPKAFERGWMMAADATRVAMEQAGLLTREQAQADIPDIRAADGGKGFGAMMGGRA